MDSKQKSGASINVNEAAWWVAALELDRQLERRNVHADEAALLLAGHDPNEVSLKDVFDMDTPVVSRADMKRLCKEFEGRQHSSLAEWLAAAREAGLVVHPVVAQVIDDASLVGAQATVWDVLRSPPMESAVVDYSLLASPEQLIRAFNTFTGMEKRWFKVLGDTPALRAARKVPGKRGRGGFSGMYCPLAVMLWLVDAKRRKGRPLSREKGWQLLGQHFPKVYAANSIGDPREVL